MIIMEERFYLAAGPVTVTIARGSAEVLGYEVSQGSSFIVPVGRHVLLKVRGEAVARSSSGGLIPASRESYAEFDQVASLALEGKRVMIVGPVDAGKSTLAAWILNKALSARRDAHFLTMDVGQNEVFCPAFAALSSAAPPVIPGNQGSFPHVKPCFVGSFSPAESLAKYFSCAEKLSREVSGLLVVDTDGWVDGEGALMSKVKLAEAVRADLVIAVGLEERAKLLEEKLAAEVIAVARLARREKSKEERRVHRERLIAQKLIGAKQRLLRAEELELEGLELFRGKPLRLNNPSTVYAEMGEGGLIVVYRGERPPLGEGVKLLRESWERGLLVSVEGDGIHVGVLDKIYYEKKLLRVFTNYEGKVKHLEVGKARVDLQSLGL
ncbi:MAG: Clp1/GlmU family protein [Acidilobaceae archaeon]|nr:Clp1/GlmU family protein [Acidilobaceae archaeon]MCX8165764.1 Clp1/GlmU family protein [Acidilobaceae archaeon]MDW7974189.1 Clp1/GlmU family protein [Sulfolobales archaeon]